MIAQAAPAGTATPGSGASVPPAPPAGVGQASYQQAVAAFRRLRCPTAPAAGSDDPAAPVAACSTTVPPFTPYLLGPAIIEGTEIADAQAAVNVGTWVVNLSFRAAGQAVWSTYGAKHNESVSPADPANEIAFVLDGRVLSAPAIQSVITGSTEVSGNFTQQTAADLASTLRYGSLPVALRVSSITTTN